VGREKSIQALESAMVEDHLIFLVSQKDAQIEEPLRDDIYSVGTIAKVRQMLKLPNGTIRVLVEGMKRARIISFIDKSRYYEVCVAEMQDVIQRDQNIEALVRSILDHFEQFLRLAKKMNAEPYSAVSDIEEPGRLADVITTH